MEAIIKILCKFHNDSTPSMHVYHNGDRTLGFCFVCGVMANLDELKKEDLRITPKSEPTNISKMIQYIDTLPLIPVRGLTLPASDRGFYIVWPQANYYKLRLWKGNTRYIAPSGVKPPLFVYPGAAKELVIVEGELNAISLHNSVYGEYKICSPGPASDLLRHIKYYSQFNKIIIVVDKDAPGVVFGCQLRDHLLKLNKRVRMIVVETDYNQVLQDSGEEAVRKEFQGAI